MDPSVHGEASPYTFMSIVALLEHIVIFAPNSAGLGGDSPCVGRPPISGNTPHIPHVREEWDDSPYMERPPICMGRLPIYDETPPKWVVLRGDVNSPLEK